MPVCVDPQLPLVAMHWVDLIRPGYRQVMSFMALPANLSARDEVHEETDSFDSVLEARPITGLLVSFRRPRAQTTPDSIGGHHAPIQRSVWPTLASQVERWVYRVPLSVCCGLKASLVSTRSRGCVKLYQCPLNEVMHRLGRYLTPPPQSVRSVRTPRLERECCDFQSVRNASAGRMRIRPASDTGMERGKRPPDGC